MDAEIIVPVRDVAGRFPPGVSGNPSGRSPGLPRELKERLAAGAPAAIDRLIELVSSDDERIALMAAETLLSRLYGKPAAASESRGETSTVQQAHLRALQEIIERRKVRVDAEVITVAAE